MRVRHIANQIAERFDSFLEKPWRPNTFRLFSKILVLWLICRNLVLLPMASEFWGPKAYIPRYFDTTYLSSYVTNLLNLFSIPSLYIYFLIGYFASYLLALVDFYPRIFMASGLFFLLNLNNRAFTSADGGDNIAMIIAALLIFVNTSKIAHGTKAPETNSNFFPWLKNFVSNTFSLIICLQICAVYLTAGLCKVIGPMWQQGTALFYIWQNDNYSVDWIANNMNSFWPLSVIATYITLAFQISLPWLIWRKVGFLIVVPVGLVIHLGIAINMALPLFGLIMCVCYIAFLPDDWSLRILNRTKFAFTKFSNQFKNTIFSAKYAQKLTKHAFKS